jgi:hypothetical protein
MTVGRKEVGLIVQTFIVAMAGSIVLLAQTPEQQPQAVFDRAVADFQAGRIA